MNKVTKSVINGSGFSWEQLTEFACKQIGFGNDNSMCGLAYPGDDKNIPLNHVGTYANFEFPEIDFEILEEKDYLKILEQTLRENQKLLLAQKIYELRKKLAK